MSDGKLRVCSQCGAPWMPVRRGECIRCGSDAGPAPEPSEADPGTTESPAVPEWVKRAADSTDAALDVAEDLADISRQERAWEPADAAP